MISYDHDIMYAQHDIMYDIMIANTNIMIPFTYDIMPFMTDIMSNIIGYIIAYITILAEPWLVLPAVSIAKFVHLKTVSQVAGTMHSEEGCRCQQPRRPRCSLITSLKFGGDFAGS